jgi:hypothetical protein
MKPVLIAPVTIAIGLGFGAATQPGFGTMPFFDGSALSQAPIAKINVAMF